MDIRRLPILVPNLSPMKAMAPPMIAIIKIIFKPTNMSSALLSSYNQIYQFITKTFMRETYNKPVCQGARFFIVLLTLLIEN